MSRQFQFVHGNFNFDLKTIISHGLISLLVSGITNKSQQVLRVSFKDGENYREGNWAELTSQRPLGLWVTIGTRNSFPSRF